jgi:beta-mannosidase
MITQSLAGKWQFRESQPSPEHGTEDGEWLAAQVPGSVHTDLMALGRIPDPFVGDNELDVQWVAERDWEYRLTFRPSPDLLAEEHVALVCDGLDTLADVTLNGRLLGQAQNMFRRYQWDVTGVLSTGENELRVRFSSPVNYVRPRQAEQPLKSPSQAIAGGSYLRKAPCQFGWDWGPQLPPSGIWKDIHLAGYSVARLDDVHLRQRHADDGTVTVRAEVAVERWQADDLKVVLGVTAPGGQTWEETRFLCKQSASPSIFEDILEIQISNPQLWWPNGLGTQPLYDVAVALYQGDTLHDRRSFQLGLRTLELRQEPDAFGTSFTFVVNGVPIFAKGANWIPADSFPARISDGYLEHLIRSTAQANMNMLRVWGGGFYEEERFYDLCDRHGILVWQDFIFACSIYPDDDAFVENVRAEAVDNVRRLRHRASLALWCGNNEMEWGWDQWGWDNLEHKRFKEAYDRMFHELLPEICAVEDPDRPYWPSSPSSNTPFVSPNGVRAGDTHNWEVWHGNRPFEAYREHHSRFVSEFGFQSLPSLETVRTYADEADWNMTSYIMEHHQRNAAGNSKIINYMTDHFRLPKDFESLIYLTQLLQAEAVRIGVEYWRRSPCTSGALYWQLNDCWPVASWASLDYFGRWKALHYAARRFYAPVLLSAEEWRPGGKAPTSSEPADEERRIRWSLETLEGEVLNTGELVMGAGAVTQLLGGGPRPSPEGWKPEVTLYVTNDLTDAWQGSVRWSLETLEGEPLRTGSQTVTVPALSASDVCTLDFAGQVNAENRREVVLVYELWQDGEDRRTSMGLIPFVPNKHLKLADPEMHCTVGETEAGFEIAVTAQRLARFVWLALEGDGPSTALNTDVVFSDNYFDLPAGRTVTVGLPAFDGWTAERVRASLCVRSLVSSFDSGARP